MVEMFVRECQLMSGLRHPNITQFLGLCFLPNCQLPILVMEKLNGSLDCLLESTPGIPLALKLSILEDVAKGLLYLHQHSPQIIHRDLTARNVLLTSSFVAKIIDFGNSRFVNFQSGKVAKTLTRFPGTLDYMPPEARKKIARYGPSLDIFSFGHLALFVGLQVSEGGYTIVLFSDYSKKKSWSFLVICLRPPMKILGIPRLRWVALRLNAGAFTLGSWRSNCRLEKHNHLYSSLNNA